MVNILKDTWSLVVYYRKNLNRLDDIKEINEKRKKYIRINTNYKVFNLNDINKNFLNNNFDLTKIHKNIKKISKNIDSDYDDYN